MPYLACATMMVLAGLATVDGVGVGDVAEPAAVVAIAQPAERAPVSFRFLTREEGHEILLSNVHVRIAHPVDGTLFEGVSNGPFLVAYVPVGRYEVAASHEGRTQRVELTVTRAEPSSLSLFW
jgi:hypothetical protein